MEGGFFMKKILCLILSAFLILSACSKKSETSASDEKFPNQTVEIVAPD